jgi:hypothetical protein
MRFFVALGLLLLSQEAGAQTLSATERYALQVQCGKQASTQFKEDYGSNITNLKSGGQLIANYQNHYSERLNKCFYLDIATTIEKGTAKSTKILHLFDMNENKEHGTNIGGICVVDDKVCGSEQEFMELIKVYMEN